MHQKTPSSPPVQPWSAQRGQCGGSAQGLHWHHHPQDVCKGSRVPNSLGEQDGGATVQQAEWERELG